MELTFEKNPLFTDVDTKQFFIVRAGFSQKRKTLHNSLSAGMHLSKDETKALLDKANIDPKNRAQALALTHWHDLYKALTFMLK
ncbi:hypothetical protein IPL68_00485 [Candidatus Saccharibacteria bacterium]|nr:MAG: hypothetical protein IPL68_00485 [Candidatus Saccharibacteria bacterium]